MSFWISLDTNCQTRNICMDCLEREKETEEVLLDVTKTPVVLIQEKRRKQKKMSKQYVYLFIVKRTKISHAGMREMLGNKVRRQKF
jgi:hypothetical protein